MLRPEFHQPLRTAGRQQICPRGGRVRQSVFEKPRGKPLSRPSSSSWIGCGGAEVKSRGINVPLPKGLVDWVGREPKMGNPTLEKAVAETGDADLKKALAWSVAVNKSIAEMVRAVPPFPYVRECLERFNGRADMIVCSQTPCAALEAEWNEHDIGEIRRRDLRPGSRQQERSPRLGQAVSAEPHADDRRRARATTKPRLPTTVCSFQSTRAPRKPVGGACTTKESPASSKAASPARIRNSCSKSSTRSCPNGHHGKLKIEDATKTQKKTQNDFL